MNGLFIDDVIKDAIAGADIPIVKELIGLITQGRDMDIYDTVGNREVGDINLEVTLPTDFGARKVKETMAQIYKIVFESQGIESPSSTVNSGSRGREIYGRLEFDYKGVHFKIEVGGKHESRFPIYVSKGSLEEMDKRDKSAEDKFPVGTMVASSRGSGTIEEWIGSLVYGLELRTQPYARIKVSYGTVDVPYSELAP